MNNIKLNNITCEVYSFNKNTYFNENGFSSTGSCNINTNDINALNELAETSIDTIQIYHDDELIYNLQNANGKIVSIDEYLNDDRMSTTINMSFSPVVEE